MYRSKGKPNKDDFHRSWSTPHCSVSFYRRIHASGHRSPVLSLRSPFRVPRPPHVRSAIFAHREASGRRSPVRASLCAQRLIRGQFLAVSGLRASAPVTGHGFYDCSSSLLWFTELLKLPVSGITISDNFHRSWFTHH
jgi:hypothetical protein